MQSCWGQRAWQLIQKIPLRSDQCVARSDRSGQSIFQVFAARGAAWIARKKSEHEDAEEKEDDRVNGDLEGEHGDRPASVTGHHPMGHDSVSRAMDPDQAVRSEWIETFRSRSRRDLRAGWRRSGAAQAGFFLDESWGAKHRPDWAKRGLLIWPRGRQWLRLEQRLSWPDGWIASDSCRTGLVLSWCAEQMRLWVDGVLVHEGDLFDTACRWPLPGRCRQGAARDLVLELCSPLHDDGALISSHLDLEPQAGGPDSELSLIHI